PPRLTPNPDRGAKHHLAATTGDNVTVQANRPLAPLVTLRAGGAAERFAIARSPEELAELVEMEKGVPTILGWGSNVLPADAGVPGLVILNLARNIEIEGTTLTADSGAGMGDVFLAAAQAGLGGLEFGVGIPGTIGGALVSNAGAYRNEIGSLVTRLQVIELGEIECGGTQEAVIREGETKWVGPEWMAFSYRDSRLRAGERRREAILRVELQLVRENARRIYDLARENQRQRIGKQPPSASAGSFFKNVLDPELAQSLPALTDGMRANGVIPAGVLIEACGLKGLRLGGAAIGTRHANFLLNLGGASATELRSLAHHAQVRVFERFGAKLEEEVLYLGDWTRFTPLPL
ncbi:MAG: UDP-N-acetylenolpyruvoylglucosamine reductase, partial [Armatimonadota bacterium]